MKSSARTNSSCPPDSDFLGVMTEEMRADLRAHSTDMTFVAITGRPLERGEEKELMQCKIGVPLFWKVPIYVAFIGICDADGELVVVVRIELTPREYNRLTILGRVRLW